MKKLIAYVTAFLLSYSLVAAQEQALEPENQDTVLVADTVRVTQDKVLVAKGNVEVFQGERSLEARGITYDRSSGTLLFEGPLVMRDGPSVLVLASDAELDTDLRNGILGSARLVLEQQLQLASVQMNRVNGRYSQLYKTSITSCKVCNDGRPPLWQIRAKSVVHDQQERQLYFNGAQLRIRNVPVFYFPRLRLPDPTLDRATGFLIPTIRSTTDLSTGIKVPFFFKLGDHKDLTATPYLSPNTRTLELRYRQAFRTGRIELKGAVSNDTLMVGTRSYLFGEGAFDLRYGFQLEFDIETTSDDAYLKQYDYSDKDRLDSEIAISRARRDEFVRIGLINYQSLRSSEINETLPTLVGDFQYERRMFPSLLGGELRFDVHAHRHRRKSVSSVSGEGRDVSRLNGGVAWLRQWHAGAVLVDTQFGLGFDVFDTGQDATFEGKVSHVFPEASVTLRYPMQRTGADGSSQFLEPIVQVAWRDETTLNVANDESTRVEFDEGNLFALSRFPEADRRERGATLAVGLNWARYDPDGWESYVSVGQIYRETVISDFTNTSGLNGDTSDLLLAGQLRSQSGLSLSGRFMIDRSFEFSKAELRGDWRSKKTTIGGSYLWLTADPKEARTKSVSELTLDGSYRIDNRWSLSGNWRYDAFDDRTAEAGLVLGYQNECVTMKLKLDRNYSNSTSVEPSTNFGFTISLKGFAATNGTQRYTRSCS